MSLPKTVRFQVFQRGNFTCAYCGQRPPNVMLEVDHIQPKAKGGTDEISNLVCACRDCNRGKGTRRLLDDVPDALIAKAAESRERLKQFKAMQKAEALIVDANNGRINALDAYWHKDVWGRDNLHWTDIGRNSVKRFLGSLSEEEIKDAMWVARRRIQWHSEEAWRYFCGICWNWIRDGGKKAHDRKVYAERGKRG